MAYGIVHTDTGYVTDYSLPNKQNWDEQAMNFLERQEEKLYSLLGKDNFTDFMAEIHRLLDSAGNVREILKRFKKANLVTYFDLPEQMSLMNQEVNIHFNAWAGINLDKIFMQLNGINGIRVNSNIGTLNFVYNERTAKNLMNLIEGREGKHAFRITGKESMTDVNRAFKGWLDSVSASGELGSFQINGKSTDINLVTHTSGKAKSLFGMKKEDIEAAVQDPQLRQQLINTRQKVYDSLYNLCAGAPDLQKIFDNVWTQKMGSIYSTNTTALLNFVFLSKGKNLNDGVSGAVQEMYGALLTEYLAFLKTQNIPIGLITIMGNIAEGGEQPKADLTILNEIGIQVKAYGMNNMFTTMEANLHPDALDAQLSPYGAVNVGDAIVQSVFNTSNESPANIANALKDYGAALLNFSTSQNLNLTSTVCFYLIDAQYLVPGSKIIEAFNNQTTEYEVKITSSYKGKSNAEWEELGYMSNSAYHYKTRPTVRLSPNYMEYFDKAGTETIHPDSKNESLYELLYTNRISIRTTFDYSFIGESNTYSIL